MTITILNKTLKVNWHNRTILKVLNDQFSFMPEKKEKKEGRKKIFFIKTITIL